MIAFCPRLLQVVYRHICALTFVFTASFSLPSYVLGESKPAKRPGSVDKASLTTKKLAELKKKIPSLRKAVAESPKDLKARYSLAKTLMATGAYDEALEHARIINQSPTAESLELFGNIQEKREDYLEAIRAYENLLIKRPKDLGVLTRLGVVYTHAGKFEVAIENLRMAIKLDPLYRPARDALLGAFEKQKNNFEARIVAGDMVKIWEKDPVLLTKLCRLHTIDGFFENGKSFCQSAIALDNSIPDNHIYLGLIHKRTQNESQGNNIIRSAARRFTRSEIAQWSAGQVAEETQNWEEALNYYSAGVKADSGSMRCLLGMANSNFQLKNYSKAKDLYLKACEKDKTLRTEYARVTALLRMKKEDKWYEVYKASEIKCGAPGLQ